MTRKQLTAILRATALLVTLPIGATLAACSSEGEGTGADGDTGGVCKEYVVPASTDLTKPESAFNTQVYPLFQKHCSYGDCHGGREKPDLGNFGDGGTDDPDVIKKNIVGVAAFLLPDMKLVEPGKPEESFLMRTMDGDQCLFNDRCREGDCGKRMPYDRGLLSVEERDAVRRWIAQGAK